MFVCLPSRAQFTFCLFFFINISFVTTSGPKMKIVCFCKETPEKGSKNGRNWISWLINLDLMSWKAVSIESCRGDCMQISRTIVRQPQPTRTRRECQPSTMISEFCSRQFCTPNLIHNSSPSKRTVCYGCRTLTECQCCELVKQIMLPVPSGCNREMLPNASKFFNQLALRSR